MPTVSYHDNRARAYTEFYTHGNIENTTSKQPYLELISMLIKTRIMEALPPSYGIKYRTVIPCDRNSLNWKKDHWVYTRCNKCKRCQAINKIGKGIDDLNERRRMEKGSIQERER